MQYVSWLLLVSFLTASIAGLFGLTLLSIGIAFVAGSIGGIISGFMLSEAANLYERWVNITKIESTKMIRFRNLFLLGGSLIILLSLIFSDPNGGAMTYIMLQQLATPVMAVGFAHLARRALFDYMDLELFLKRAFETSQGAAIAFAGVSLIIYGLLGLFGGQVR